LDNNSPASLLDAICSRLRPETVPAIRATIETAIAEQCGDQPDPAAVVRFLEDIRLAQSLSGADIDYAQHYTQLHRTGEAFMRLIQTVNAAKSKE